MALEERDEMAAPTTSKCLNGVEAELAFIEPAGGGPIAYSYRPPSDAPRRAATYAAHRVWIRNGRSLTRQTSLDREAFVMVQHSSRLTKFDDDGDIKGIYYPEVAALAREHTGATEVLVFDHTLRTTSPAGGRPNVLEPAMVMHNDYTTASVPRRIRELLLAEMAARMLRHRVVQLTLWRPIRGPMQTKPLAVCDAASLKEHNCIRGELHYPDRISEFYAIAYDPEQRWYYFPDMQPGEALLFKGYDSDTSRAQFGGHGAFNDPTTPADACPRESIETRAFAFFAPE